MSNGKKINTAVADLYLAEALKLDNAKDPRTQATLNNIATACKALLNENEDITYTTVGNRCKKDYGKPSKGTILNDKNGLYHPLVNEYASLSVLKENRSVEEKNKDNEYKGLPSGTKIYINHLETRLAMLEKVVKAQDKETIQGKVYSLAETLKVQPDQKGHVDPVLSQNTGLTAAQTDALKLLLANDVKFIGKGGSRRGVDPETNNILINPSQLKLLNSIVEGE